MVSPGGFPGRGAKGRGLRLVQPPPGGPGPITGQDVDRNRAAKQDLALAVLKKPSRSILILKFKVLFYYQIIAVCYVYQMKYNNLLIYVIIALNCFVAKPIGSENPDGQTGNRARDPPSLGAGLSLLC